MKKLFAIAISTTFFINQAIASEESSAPTQMQQEKSLINPADIKLASEIEPPHNRALNISNMNLTDKDIEELAKHRELLLKLQRLNLSGNKEITDHGLKILFEKVIKDRYIGGVHLNYINLGMTSITQASRDLLNSVSLYDGSDHNYYHYSANKSLWAYQTMMGDC